ncbi:DUF3592 domain-containing protein [Streptomyces ovatisporus]|uniref:DUF3592 domain-containing protein n=1 Tax=Streptomyces ovatisporus TaxID=1128682 RepID=A0ABV9ACS3_9ACTN
MAAGPPAFPPALHPDQFLLAEPGGAVARRTHSGPRRKHHAPGGLRMSSLSDQGAGAGPLGPAGTEAAASGGGSSALHHGARIGRAVAIVTPLALIANAASWLVLGAGPLRTALAWSCTVVLALCLFTVFVVRAGSPVTDTAPVYWSAWQTGLRGSLSRWWRLIVGGFLLPAFVALLFGMGSSALENANDSQRIAASGGRVVATSVEEVHSLGKSGEGRVGYRARYDVRLPEGRRVQVEFVNERNLSKGDTVYVGYAPSDPELQPVGDDERSQVEQQLSGRSMEFRQWVAVLIGWTGGTVALVVWLIRGGAGRLPKGRMKRAEGGMASAPARINGYIEYAVPRPNKSPDGFQGLKIHSGDRDLAFQVPGCNAKYAAVVLTGQSGQLEWPVDLPEATEENLLATTPVDFVAPDGRRLPGNVPTHSLQNLTAQGVAQAMSSPPGPAQTVANAVDLGAAWPLTLPRAVLLLLLLVLVLPAPLNAVPHAGGWGVALLIASAASAAAAGVVMLYRDHKHKPQTDNQ